MPPNTTCFPHLHMHSRLTIWMQKELHKGRMGARCEKVPQTQQTTVMQTSKWKMHKSKFFHYAFVTTSYATIGMIHVTNNNHGNKLGTHKWTIHDTNTQHEQLLEGILQVTGHVAKYEPAQHDIDKRHEVDEWTSDKWHEWDSTDE